MSLIFESLVYLAGLFILPFIVFVHFYMLKYRKRRALRFANFETLKRLDSSWFYSKNMMQLCLRLLFVTAIVLSFAGPSISYLSKGSDYDIIFNIDVSGSMLAADISPNRLEAVKSGLVDFMEHSYKGGKVGLVTFGGMAFINVEPTEEVSRIIAGIDSISISAVPGTSIGNAIQTSANLFTYSVEQNGNADMIVLITDGQENVLKHEELMEVIDYAKKRNIILNIIGVGTPEGAQSEIIEDSEARFMMNQDALHEIADRAGDGLEMVSTEDELFNAINSFSEEMDIQRQLNLTAALFIIAMVILFIEWNLSNFHFKSFPE